MAVLDRAQKTGARAITGAFRTVAVSIAEAEAYIRPIRQRHFESAAKLWTGIQTFPVTHPLKKMQTGTFRRFLSPLQRIAMLHQPTSKIETVQAFSVSPCQKRRYHSQSRPPGSSSDRPGCARNSSGNFCIRKEWNSGNGCCHL
jgi:hypothetical protein